MGVFFSHPLGMESWGLVSRYPTRPDWPSGVLRAPSGGTGLWALAGASVEPLRCPFPDPSCQRWMGLQRSPCSVTCPTDGEIEAQRGHGAAQLAQRGSARGCRLQTPRALPGSGSSAPGDSQSLSCCWSQSSLAQNPALCLPLAPML